MLHYRYIADRYMIKNKYLYNFFEIDAYGIRMFANSKNRGQENGCFKGLF